MNRLAHAWQRLYGTSIRRRLIIGIAATHAVLMALFVGDMVIRQREFLHAQILERAHGRAATLAASSRSWVLTRDIAGLEELVTAQRALMGLKYAMVLSPRGRVLGHTDPSRIGLHVTDDVSLRLLQSAPGAIELVVDAMTIDVAAPIIVQDQLIGWVRVGLGSEAERQALATILRDGLLYILTAIAVGVAMAVFIAKGMLMGLDTMLAVMQRVGSGERGLRIRSPRRDELGTLSNGFDAMVETVELREQQQQHMRSEIAHQRSFYQALIENSMEGISIHGVDGEMRYASPSNRHIHGHTPDDLVGRNLREIVHPQDMPLLEAKVAEIAKTAGGVFNANVRLRHKNNGWVTVNARVRNALDNPAIRGLVNNFRDVTGLLQTEAALRRSEASLNEAQRIARVGSWELDLLENTLVWSDEVFRIFELDPDRFEATYKAFLDVVHPDDRASMDRAYTHSVQNRQPCEIMHRLQMPDGRIKYVQERGETIYDADGKPLRSIGSVQDITDRHLAKLALERLNKLYRLLGRVNEAIVHANDTQALFETACQAAVDSGLFEMAWVGMLADDQETVQVAASAGRVDGYLDALNICIHDPVLGNGPTGASIREGRHVVSKDTKNNPAVAPWRERKLTRGYLSSGSFPLQQGDATVGAFTVYAAQPDFFDDEIIALMDELAADIGFALHHVAESRQRERAEEEIRQLNTVLEQRVRQRTQELEAANRELEAFSYSVSHDLRAPLRSIEGFSDILLRKHAEQLDDKGRDYLSRVQAAAQRMARLIDDLLALARLSRSSMRREQVDLSALAAEVVDELRRAEPQRDVQVNIASGMILYGDPILMRTVLQNLIGNAWKYTGKLATARIEFGAQADEKGDTSYYVRDNGAGFDMRHIEKLFGPFQRLHSEHDFPGTGIGLATVQRVIHRHNGRVWADAKPGEGATFFFTLPQRQHERRATA